VTTANNQDRGAGGTVAPEGAGRNFKRRAVSALVLAPVAIVAAYLGGWVFIVVCALAAGAVLWEWTQLVARGAEPRILAPGFAALAVAAAFVGTSAAAAAICAIAIGAILAGVMVAVWPRREVPQVTPAWGAGGVIYAGIVLLFAVVWATDIFAYLVGRSIGGPLLWPRLSPNKTWSGAIGGFLGGVAAGVAVAYASGGTRGAVAGALALALSLVAQGGDLFESAIKRRFGVKDTGHLIPGHGGVMDRLDGFLVAAFAAVLIGILRQGVAAPARGLLVW
jgi:phosphatidate cytidylyltransferase